MQSVNSKQAVTNKQLQVEIPLSLYIHIPWCIRKCPYCDFNSHPLRGHVPTDHYTTRLLFDLEKQLAWLQNRPIESIFIGGGTPSLFPAEGYAHLFEQMRKYLNFKQDIEITLEANPGASERSRFYDYRQLGINRLSIGMQSLDDRYLKTLGRIHSSQDARQAFESARESGFNNINIDLMHALPGQSIADALVDLEQGLALKPEHVSWYQLTLEPNTYFYKYPPKIPSNETAYKIQEKGIKMLESAGFKHYEVSAFHQAYRACRHNLNYWQFGDYLGIGAGAHSKLTDLKSGEVWRFIKAKHPNHYLDKDKPLIINQEKVKRGQLGLEFMMNALRLQKPIPIKLLQQRTGLNLTELEQPLAKAVAQELLSVSQTEIRVTPLGKRFLNDLLALFL